MIVLDSKFRKSLSPFSSESYMSHVVCKNLEDCNLNTPGNCKKCAHHSFPTHFSSSVTKLPAYLQFTAILTQKATLK